MPTLILKLLAAFIGEAVSAWFLYRCRAAAYLSWASSDLVVFGLPFAIGFVALATILLRRGAARQPSAGRAAAMLALAAGGALASFCAGMFVGANLYGT